MILNRKILSSLGICEVKILMFENHFGNDDIEFNENSFLSYINKNESACINLMKDLLNDVNRYNFEIFDHLVFKRYCTACEEANENQGIIDEIQKRCNYEMVHEFIRLYNLQ